jgi:hypothetical protein
MQVEFHGGPVDGQQMDVPEGTRLWVVSTPAMSAAEFIAAQDQPDILDYAMKAPREFAYRKTKRITQAGLWAFQYMGERVAE